MSKEYPRLIGQSNRQLIHREQVTSCNPLLVVSKTEEKEPMRPADDYEDGCNILLKGVYF
jgi:hypothetical protein